MTTAYDPKKHNCWAGRWAFFGGHPDWRSACPDMMLIQHVVFFEQNSGDIKSEILLCDRHYRQVLTAGLISEPDPPPEKIAEAKRRFGE